VNGATQTVPISIALVAGALVALNSCSVPLLPAFLSYYLGVERAVAARRLQAARDGYRLAWRAGAPHERLLGSIAHSAVDLLTSPELRRVRECSGEGCGWLFLDGSKAHRRRWCSMAISGNRAKARRHWERGRAAAGR
jgi:predicted RNA-binding Zn ribbon-like protein